MYKRIITEPNKRVITETKNICLFCLKYALYLVVRLFSYCIPGKEIRLWQIAFLYKLKALHSYYYYTIVIKIMITYVYDN